MKATKLLCVLLALMLAAATLLSCAQPTEAPDSSDSSDTPDTPDTPNVPDEGEEEKPFNLREAVQALPACTFGGEEFLIAASSTYEGRFTIDQFPTADSRTGALVQDALFERDALIEEILGVDLAYDDVYDSAMYAKISNSVRSGDDTYSLVLGSLSSVGVNMFNNSLLYNLNEVPHLDLTQTWWNKNSIDNFQINDQIYMATGAITNRYVYSPYAMLFNRKLIEDISLDDPYMLLDNGDWTLEKFSEMIEDTYLDLNADDKVDILDFYGLAPASDSETAYYFAANARMLNKDDDGELIFVYMEDSNLSILEDVIFLYDSDNVLKYQDTYDSIAAFREGRAIFHSMALCDITMLNDMQDEYGIVPMPKYDSYQEEFYSNANRYISTLALLPSSIVDIDNVGLVVEALAMASQYTSLDKQYEQVLLNRQALDAQSKDSLIRVVESTSYDLCYAFNLGGMVENLRPVINSGGSYASFYARYEKSLPLALEEFMEKYE